MAAGKKKSARKTSKARSKANATQKKKARLATRRSAKKSAAKKSRKKPVKKVLKSSANRSAAAKKTSGSRKAIKAKVKTGAKAGAKIRAKASKPAKAAKRAAPKPKKTIATAKSAAMAALRAARISAHVKRPLPKPILPDLADLESIVAHASKDSSERLISEATKFNIGIAHNGMAMPQAELPSEYGNDRVMLLVVDPSFVFTYWEVTNGSLKHASDIVGPSGKLTLRFYDISRSDSTHGSHHWDVEIFDRMGNWYLKLAHPEQRLCLDIGLKNASGFFHTISRSNVMRLPPQGLAKPGPIKWMVVTPSGEKLISDVEEYTDADMDLLKRILGPYFYDLLMRGRLASITGSSMEAIFYDVSNLSQPPGQSPTGASWSQAR